MPQTLALTIPYNYRSQPNCVLFTTDCKCQINGVSLQAIHTCHIQHYYLFLITDTCYQNPFFILSLTVASTFTIIPHITYSITV